MENKKKDRKEELREKLDKARRGYRKRSSHREWDEIAEDVIDVSGRDKITEKEEEEEE